MRTKFSFRAYGACIELRNGKTSRSEFGRLIFTFGGTFVFWRLSTNRYFCYKRGGSLELFCKALGLDFKEILRILKHYSPILKECDLWHLGEGVKDLFVEEEKQGALVGIV